MATSSAAAGSDEQQQLQLDRDSFTKTIDVVALRVAPKQCSDFMRRMRGHVIDRQRIKPILTPADDSSSRLMLLSESIGPDLAELPAELREFVQAEGASIVKHSVTIGYEHLTAEQVLRSLLPSGMEVPSAFEQVGHVAHVNLRYEHAPYKTVIGQVLLDKNTPRIRSVVNKVESISNEFRVFPMEVLAGEENLLTSVKENGAKFELDYREVYWNSRLETEHKRILDLLPPRSVVADVFAGIGPFAVPAGMRGCRVYANDLNPKSHEYLERNVKGNKCAGNVRTYNLDGRAFVQELLSSSTDTATATSSSTFPPNLPFGYFSNVLMNLPASALTFLDSFVHAFDRTTWKAPLPTIHCYCFSKEKDYTADVLQIAESTMGCKLPDAKVIVVRDVAPQKLMLCLTFQVPEEIGWKKEQQGEGSGGAAKRQRSE